MAYYDIYFGGNQDKSFYNVETKKPFHSQMEHRTDSLGDRKIVTWCDLMKELGRRFGKNAKDLVVGDTLGIFLIPNHSTYESLGVHLSQLPAGFEFDLTSQNSLALTSDKYESQIDAATGAVLSTTKTAGALPTSLGGAAVVPQTNVFVLADRTVHTSDSDVVVLEIKALPADWDGSLSAVFRVDFDNAFVSGYV